MDVSTNDDEAWLDPECLPFQEGMVTDGVSPPVGPATPILWSDLSEQAEAGACTPPLQELDAALGFGVSVAAQAALPSSRQTYGAMLTSSDSSFQRARTAAPALELPSPTRAYMDTVLPPYRAGARYTAATRPRESAADYADTTASRHLYNDSSRHASGGSEDARRALLPTRDWFGGRASTRTTPVRRQWTAAIFMRERKLGSRVWFEFLLEFRNGAYQFLQADAARMRAAEVPMFLMEAAAHRGMMFVPKHASDIDKCLQTETLQDATCHHVYMVPFAATQRPRAERELGLPPTMAWAAESELAVHVQLGLPAVFGRPVCSRSLAALATLPVHFRFASASPPLMLYLGIPSRRDAVRAAAGGLNMKEHAQHGRAGNAIYLSKWPAAAAAAGADGSVLRVLVLAPTCMSLTASHRCACGACDGAAFTDHTAAHRAGADMVFVPDTASAEAAWAVFEACFLHVECVQHVSSNRKL
jgi:hypothetical protein